jgi:hypothetical protein
LPLAEATRAKYWSDQVPQLADPTSDAAILHPQGILLKNQSKTTTSAIAVPALLRKCLPCSPICTGNLIMVGLQAQGIRFSFAALAALPI